MKIVHVEDDPRDVELVRTMLLKQWPECRIVSVDTEQALTQELQREPPSLILSDYSLPRFDGVEALRVSREIWPDVPFIFLSGTIGEDVAVEALKNGAIDYIIKDRMVRLVPAVQRALAQTAEEARRHAAEHALIESQELFRQITENVGDLIAVVDAEGRMVYHNPVYRVAGGEGTPLNSLNIFGGIHPDDRARAKAALAEAIQTGVTGRCDYRLRLPDGRIRYLESQCSVLPLKPGELPHVLVVSHDMTERKEAEGRISEQASLLDRARDAICVTDLEQKITYWNASAARLFAWTTGEVMGRPLGALLFSRDATRFDEAMRRLHTDGQWMGELRPSNRVGEEVIVESRCTLVSDTAGHPRSALFIITDVSEKKRLEVQFLRAQRMESIGTLAGGIAHDLNNVLTPVLVASQLLQSQVSNKESRQMLQIIEKSALHGAALIKQVLLFARGGEGEYRALNLRHLVLEMEKFLRETFPRTIEIRARMDRDLALVKGDATQLKQVIMNLCVNARDSLQSGGRIFITGRTIRSSVEFMRTHPEARAIDYVLLSVEDNGSGIAPAHLERVFDPFFTTKEIGKGTGLGLSTVLGIAKGHGGWVNLSSEVNKGTRFEIYLPAVAVDQEVPADDSRAPLALGAGQGVLVIDDEQPVREVIQAMLTHCGYRSFVAENGAAGVELYRQHRDEIDVVLVDMIMPRIDGRMTIRLLRELNPALRVIAISGMLENEGVARDQELGDVELLRKPITAESLLNKLAEILKTGR